LGLEVIACEIEVHIAERGFAATTIVRLPDAAVRESTVRVQTVSITCGYRILRHRSVIDLAPPDVKNGGPPFDLAIGLGATMGGEPISGELLDDHRVSGRR
jgi:magnesium chelatase family protein